jgi:hypothetical protein
VWTFLRLPLVPRTYQRTLNTRNLQSSLASEDRARQHKLTNRLTRLRASNSYLRAFRQRSRTRLLATSQLGSGGDADIAHPFMRARRFACAHTRRDRRPRPAKGCRECPAKVRRVAGAARPVPRVAPSVRCVGRTSSSRRCPASPTRSKEARSEVADESNACNCARQELNAAAKRTCERRAVTAPSS